MPRLALCQRNRRPAAVLTPARCGLQYVGKRYAGWVKKEAAKRATQEHAEPFNGDADQCREDLTEHYAKVVKFATQESKVIKRVFPHPEKLLGKLVERIFAERISVHLKQMFSVNLQDDPLVYCTTLAMAVQETRALAQQLNSLGTGDVNAIKLANAEISQYTESYWDCLLYTSPSPRDKRQSRMPSSA